MKSLTVCGSHFRVLTLVGLLVVTMAGCAQNDLPAIPTPVAPTPLAAATPTASATVSGEPSPLPVAATTTATARPTQTSVPTVVTIAPTIVRATSTQEWPPCLTNKEAPQHVGETVCVQATVYNVNQTESAYFIDFDASRTSFYAVSFTLTKEHLRLAKGQCIRLRGRIDTYNQRPQLVIRNLDQLASCQ